MANRVSARKGLRVYDGQSGRTSRLEGLILKLGVEAVAQKYRVTASTVHKWRRGIHKPARRTIARSFKTLF